MTAMIPSLLFASLLLPASAPSDHDGDHPADIVTTAVEAGSFSTLAAALKAAGLVEALQGKGPFTVFAPTDEAFAKLDPKALKSLLQPENRAQLQRILQYHVVSGRIGSAQALAAGKARTLAGETVSIALDGGRLKVAGARVVANDVPASNGVIHVIDTVLLPPTPQGELSIGAETDFAGSQIKAYLGLGDREALVVESVKEGCPLKVGDVIIGIQGEDYRQGLLTASRKAVGYGGTLSLRVIRRGEHEPLELRCPVGVE